MCLEIEERSALNVAGRIPFDEYKIFVVRQEADDKRSAGLRVHDPHQHTKNLPHAIVI
jgi:hypothetical protein